MLLPTAGRFALRSCLRNHAHPLRKVDMSSSLSADSNSRSTESSHSVAQSLANVLERIASVSSAVSRQNPARLVAVSKTKPLALLREAYSAGQRHFGENYVQELVAKAPEMPDDVRWHFIGSMQSNKARALVSVPNLFCMESVDREKTATALQKAALSLNRPEKLHIMIQVNTSGEDSKSGCHPDEAADLAVFVTDNCDRLHLYGLMTIGAPDTSDEPEAFKILARAREVVAERIGRSEESLILSMGMSGDFEAAIRMGSDSVRVGSTIFGAREYPNKN